MLKEIKVLKTKKDRHTVIEVDGLRYILEHQDRSKLDKAIGRKKNEHNKN